MRLSSLERRSHLLLAVILFALLIIISYQINTDQETTLLEKVIHRISSPFVRLFFGTIKGVSSLWGNYFDLVGVQKENEDLKQKMDQLRIRIMELEEKNKQYKELDHIVKWEYPYEEEFVFAKVIFRSFDLSDQFAIINRGSYAGIKKNMTVIVPEGLVGNIEEVGLNDSRVRLMTDPSSQIAVYVEADEETRVSAMLSGNVETCFLKYLPKDFPVEKGYPVVTSGLDLKYYPSIPAGKIKKADARDGRDQDRDRVNLQYGEIGAKTDMIHKKDGGDIQDTEFEEKSITVEPAVDFSRLNEVAIIKKVIKVPESFPK